MSDDAPRPLLRSIVASLAAIEIPHMIVGSFASTFHGEPRTTRALDLVIDPVYIEHWVAELELAEQWRRARGAV